MTSSSIVINIPDKSKARIVAYNRYKLFRGAEVLTDLARQVEFFNEKWSNSLESLLKNAISNERLLTHNLVRHKLTETKWTQALSSIVPDKIYCEFSYEGLLCIAQLDKQDNNEFELKNLWGLRYSNLPYEVICIDLGSQSQRDKLEEIARRFGERAEEVAKRAIIDKIENIINNLESQNQALILEVESLKEQRRQVNIGFYREAINSFRDRLEGNYHETKGDNSWQAWIYKNNWLFGVQYGQPIERTRVGFSSIPDFLFPTIDGFIDVLEIKLPSHKVIDRDKSHPGSFIWSPKTSEAIGQTINYLHEIEINQLQLYQQINRVYASELRGKVTFIKPRAFILIGRSNDWDETTREALRKLNHALHGIEILTYDDLLARGQSLIDLYVREIR